MEKIKHSFLKNSLQLFCYKNVLNESSNIYTNYLNDSDYEESPLRRANEIKRKHSTINNTKNKFAINESENNKKMQNIFIHYTGDSKHLTPDLVSKPSSLSPKSPLSKHAKHNPDENLLDLNATDILKRTSLIIKDAAKMPNVKLNRSKSTNTKNFDENYFSNRSRILSPVPTVSSIKSSPSSESGKLTTNAKYNNNLTTPASAPPTLTTSTTSTTMSGNYRNSKGAQLYHRQSYPPDASVHQNNNLYSNNFYSYTTLHNTQNDNSPTQRFKNSKPLTTTTTKPIEFEISYNLNENSVKHEQQTVNGVKLRKHHQSPTSNGDKTKRSLSAVSNASTKKSVRFADSVGLELENIFNLSALDTSKNNNFEKISLLFNNNNEINSFYDNCTTIPLEASNITSKKFVTRSNTISSSNTKILNFTISPSMSNSSSKNSTKNFEKTIKLANLTVRTRINRNGKLESEV